MTKWDEPRDDRPGKDVSGGYPGKEASEPDWNGPTDGNGFAHGDQDTADERRYDGGDFRDFSSEK